MATQASEYHFSSQVRNDTNTAGVYQSSTQARNKTNTCHLRPRSRQYASILDSNEK